MLIGQVKNVGLEGANGGYTSYEFFVVTNLNWGRWESRGDFSTDLPDHLVGLRYDGGRKGYVILKKEYNEIGEF